MVNRATGVVASGGLLPEPLAARRRDPAPGGARAKGVRAVFQPNGEPPQTA